MDNQTSVSIKFTNSVTGEKKLEKYAETLKQINGVLGAMDKGKINQITKNLDSQASSAKSSKNEVGKMAKNFNTAFDAGKIATFTKGFEKIITKMSSFTKKSADFAENWNLLDVAFNNSTKEAEKFVNTLSEMYGLDESWGYRTVGLFKQLSNAMGLTDELGTDLSKTLTQLSIDLASLYNVDVDDAVSKLQSALAGQTKPVRLFGADITQNTLQLTLETHGIDRAVSDLSYAEKRLLIVASVLEQTDEAQGDWGRTIESTANQMRIFQQQTERLSRAIGDVFAPVLKAILPIMNAVLMVLTELISMFATWIATLFGYEKEDYFSGASESIDDMATGLGVASENAKKLKSGLRGFDKLNNITTPQESSSGAGGGTGLDSSIVDLYTKASEDYLKKLDETKMKATEIRDKIMEWLGFTKLVDEETGKVSFKFEKLTGGTVLGALAVGGTVYVGVMKIVGLLSKLSSIGGTAGGGILAGMSGGTLAIIAGVAGAIALLAYSIYDLYQTNEEFAQSFDEKWQGIKDAIAPIIENVIELFDTLKIVYDETIKPMVEEIYEIIQTIAATILEILYPVFTEFILPIIEQVIQMINDQFAILNELWKEYGEPISNAIKEAIKGIGDIFEKLWVQFLQPIIKKVMEIIEDLWNNTLKPMSEKINGIVLSIIELLLALWNNVFEPIVKWLIDKLAPGFETVFSFIGDVIHTVVKFIGGIINGLLDIFKGIIDFLVGVFTGDFKKALNGIVGVLKGIANIMISIFEGIVNGIISLVNLCIKAVYNGIKSFINTILSTVEGIADFLGFDLDITLKGSAPQIPKVSIPRLKVGMDFVPNDNFPAMLDYGERVLTKEENADYNKGIIRGEVANGQPMNATFIIQVGDEELSRKVLDDLQGMAKSNGEPIVIG